MDEKYKAILRQADAWIGQNRAGLIEHIIYVGMPQLLQLIFDYEYSEMDLPRMVAVVGRVETIRVSKKERMSREDIDMLYDQEGAIKKQERGIDCFDLRETSPREYVL